MMDYENFIFKLDRDQCMGFYKEDDDFMIRPIFIRYFEIKNNEIHIHTSKKIMIFPYTKELELKILEKMKKQIETFKKEIEEAKTNGALMYAYILNSGLYLFISCITRNYLNLITAAMWLSASSIPGIPYINKKIKQNDIQKHILFLENEDKINEMIKYKMLELGLTDKEAINLTPEFEAFATINDIHFLKMDEVKSLVNGNISKDLIYKLKKEL